MLDIETPENGSGWLCDAAIPTIAFLDATVGADLSEELRDSMPEDSQPEWDGGDESEKVILEWIQNREEGREYHRVTRDNVYNNEQDFSDVFTPTEED